MYPAPTGYNKRRPPLRVGDAPDDSDGDRVSYVQSLWHSQDAALRLRDRSVEENVRMIVGQHWNIFDPLTGQFLDPSKWMDERERRWRQRPTFNRILPWFMLTHARMTENPPIVTFLPGPDRKDAVLAETWDILLKNVWRKSGMTEVHDRMTAWMIPGGRAYLMSRIDPTLGDLREWRGLAAIPRVNGDGSPVLGPDGLPAMVEHPNAPLDKNGHPLAVMTPDGPMETGKPYFSREGEMVIDVLSALEARGEWGPAPWHRKRWHATRSYLTPEQVYATYGIECEPDITGQMAEDTGYLQRLLFGAGFFGAASGALGAENTMIYGSAKDGYCEVTTLYEAPAVFPPGDQNYQGLEGMEQTPDSPGGRLCVVTKAKVLTDGPRPLAYRYTSPVRSFGFVRIPGRPQESTPQEAMNAVNRAYNRGWGQLLEYRNLCTNPIFTVDAASGMGDQEFSNQPGVGYEVLKRAGVNAIEWIRPPELGRDTYEIQSLLLKEINDIGNMRDMGAPTAPGRDASGQLVKELRFDYDRYLGPTARRLVEEYARMIEDWMVIVPVLFDQPKVIQYTGEDNVARTLTVYPDVLRGGSVDVVPDMESMLPEGRGERQARVYRMYLDGMFGIPGSPPAIKQFFELAQFPHLSRAGKPGGVDRTMAERLLGMVVQGAAFPQIPYYDWFDDAVHLDVFETYMKAPEFLAQPPEVQQTLTLVRSRYHFMQQGKVMQQAMQAAQLQSMMMPPGDGDGDEGPSGVQPPGGKPNKNPGAKRAADQHAKAARARPDSAAEHAPAGMAPAATPLGMGGPTI